jgi:hypothetical protein
MTSKHNLPGGFKAIGIFLFFGAAMAAIAGFTLTWRGTALDRIWALNLRAHQQLAPLGSIAGISFLVLSLVLASAGLGWLLRRRWGWVLAVVVIASQLIGDFVNALRGELLAGTTGFFVAGGLLLYLLHPRVRAAFAGHSQRGENWSTNSTS